MTMTPRLGLELIDDDEILGYVSADEALLLLERLVQCTVIRRDLATPPGSPAEGDQYIVASSPTGAWSGHATHLATYLGATWVFKAPQKGWEAYDQTANEGLFFNGTAWGVITGSGGAGSFTLNAGASTGLTAPGAITTSGGTYTLGATTDQVHFATMTLTPPAASTTRALDVTQTGTNTNTSNTSVYYNQIFVDTDQLNTNATGPLAQETAAVHIRFRTGGAASSGQKYALRAATNHNIASAPAVSRDHIAAELIAQASVNDGGTNTGAGAMGTLYGFAGHAFALAGATNYVTVAGSESGVSTASGSSMRYRFGHSIVDYGTMQGAEHDAALEIAASTGGGWQHGITFSDIHGGGIQPVTATGTLIKTGLGSFTVANGIDFALTTMTGYFLKGPGSSFTVDGAGVTRIYHASVTGAAVPVLTLRTAGQNSGNGPSIDFLIQDNAPADRIAGRVRASLTDGTAGALDADLILSAMLNGTLTDQLYVYSSGAMALNVSGDPGTAGWFRAKRMLIRDTSAAYDVHHLATSSVTLTAPQGVTWDVQNKSHTLKLPSTDGTITYPVHLGSAVTLVGMLSKTRPNQTINNSAANVDFTSVYTIPANMLTTGTHLQVILDLTYTMSGSPTTSSPYLKLGSTTVYTQSAVTLTAGSTRHVTLQLNIYGTATPGSSVNVEVSNVSTWTNNTNHNATATQALNTSSGGGLTVVPGITWGATGSADAVTLRSATIIRYA